MMKFSYALPLTEAVGDNGEVRRTTENVSFDENTATVDLLAKEIKKLEALGYDVNVTIKLKLPKD